MLDASLLNATMISRVLSTLTFIILMTVVTTAAPTITQSLTISFPSNGPVTVEAREESGQFPQMVFTSRRTNRTLLVSSIEDREKWLIPSESDTAEGRPSLRFRVINSRGLPSPVVMSVGLFTGGSDNAYFLTLFAEVGGKIVRLNDQPLFANVQGGYYLGRLNKRFGYGLAVWDFVWEDGRPHYAEHRYAIELYRIERGRLKRILRTTSRRMYDSDKGADSLRELGIKVIDQRNAIRRIKNTIGT